MAETLPFQQLQQPPLSSNPKQFSVSILDLGWYFQFRRCNYLRSQSHTACRGEPDTSGQLERRPMEGSGQNRIYLENLGLAGKILLHGS
jgi:hypothetical protein